MMANRKQLLHEFLKEDQEPFQLKSYVAEQRPHPMKKRNININSSSKNIASLQSPIGGSAVFLHLRSRANALLVESSMRNFRKQQQYSKPKNGIGEILRSFLRILKNRCKNEASAIGIKHKDLKVICAENRPSPCRFYSHRSTSYSRSPVAPRRHAVDYKEKENDATTDQKNTMEDEEKEQCSPVSVLDPPFEEDEHESAIDAGEDDKALECTSAIVHRSSSEQESSRGYTRFDRLARLIDPIQLETRMFQNSGDNPLSRNDVETFIDHLFDYPSFQLHSFGMSKDMKMLVSDLILDKTGSKEVDLDAICDELESWEYEELDTFETTIESDFNKNLDQWREFSREVEETVIKIEVAIFKVLVDEMSGNKKM